MSDASIEVFLVDDGSTDGTEQAVLEHYPQSMHDGDALAIMAESYTRLGQDTLANDARRVLTLNHPEHGYLHGDWPAERSLWKKMWPFDDERDASALPDEPVPAP